MLELKMELSVNETLKLGIEAQKAGKYQEAERFYRGILNSQSNHPVANHNLGILALRKRKLNSALLYFKTAIKSS